jgi:RNA polymerase sigma-70 factor (ECF subfamily)
MIGAGWSTPAAGRAAEDPLEGLPGRVLAGDTEAFERLVALTEAKVLGLAWRLLGDRDQARDAAQEVYLRVYRSLAAFRPGDGLAAWMYRITVNVCSDHARRRGPAMIPVDPEDRGHGAGHGHQEEVLLRSEHRDLVRRALATLTSAERSAIVLRDLEGLETAQVARILGVRPVTVRGQAAAARVKIQQFCARILGMKGGRP